MPRRTFDFYLRNCCFQYDYVMTLVQKFAVSSKFYKDKLLHKKDLLCVTFCLSE